MKKLIPAIAMLLISIVLLSTASFAWFSMNTTVTVTGMEIKAKTDNTYLLISTSVSGADEAAEAASIQEGGLVTVDFAMGPTEVYPSAPALTAAEAAYLPVSTGKKVGEDAITVAGVQVTNAATVATVTNWYTANAASPEAATIKNGSARQLTTFDGYVVHKTVYLTVAAGSNPANNLSVTATMTQKTGGTDIDAVKMVIVTNDGGFAVITTSNTSADISGTNTDITDTTVRVVDIWLYYDGNATEVYTNNMANLTGVDIVLDFNVDSNP